MRPLPTIPDTQALVGKTPEELDEVILGLRREFRQWIVDAYKEAYGADRRKIIDGLTSLLDVLDAVATDVEGLLDELDEGA